MPAHTTLTRCGFFENRLQSISVNFAHETAIYGTPDDSQCKLIMHEIAAARKHDARVKLISRGQSREKGWTAGGLAWSSLVARLGSGVAIYEPASEASWRVAHLPPSSAKAPQSEPAHSMAVEQSVFIFPLRGGIKRTIIAALSLLSYGKLKFRKSYCKCNLTSTCRRCPLGAFRALLATQYSQWLSRALGTFRAQVTCGSSADEAVKEYLRE